MRRTAGQVLVLGLLIAAAVIALWFWPAQALAGDMESLRAWDRNSDGQPGDRTSTDRMTPEQVWGPEGVGALDGIATVAAGDGLPLAVRGDGVANAVDKLCMNRALNALAIP